MPPAPPGPRATSTTGAAGTTRSAGATGASIAGGAARAGSRSTLSGEPPERVAELLDRGVDPILDIPEGIPYRVTGTRCLRRGLDLVAVGHVGCSVGSPAVLGGAVVVGARCRLGCPVFFSRILIVGFCCPSGLFIRPNRARCGLVGADEGLWDGFHMDFRIGFRRRSRRCGARHFGHPVLDDGPDGVDNERRWTEGADYGRYGARQGGGQIAGRGEGIGDERRHGRFDGSGGERRSHDFGTDIVHVLDQVFKRLLKDLCRIAPRIGWADCCRQIGDRRARWRRSGCHGDSGGVGGRNRFPADRSRVVGQGGNQPRQVLHGVRRLRTRRSECLQEGRVDQMQVAAYIGRGLLRTDRNICGQERDGIGHDDSRAHQRHPGGDDWANSCAHSDYPAVCGLGAANCTWEEAE